jgi:hypothetical protein|tara:strand:+ start:314 stop:556 length:243 start_codon:yes stop_codon:yes gene_type:complete
MNFVDLIFTCFFGGTPALPPLPPLPEPLPDVEESDDDRKERMRKLASKKQGRSSLITNEGGAAGLSDETDATKKTKLGGN